MKLRNVWAGVSVAVISSIVSANNNADLNKDVSLVEKIKIQHNADGSIELFDIQGNSIILDLEIVEIIKKIDSSEKANFFGNRPCVGKPVKNTNISNKQ